MIDNYGDVGVSWRLARQLHTEHRLDVSLWLDDLGTFHRLCPGSDPGAPVQVAGGVTIRHWTPGTEFGPPADVVIDAFGSRAPDAYQEAMARRAHPPVWINLEYLSAEDWVEECHGMASPHPRLPLTRYFYFPGFTRATGGLLEESDLAARRLRTLGDPLARDRVWRDWGQEPPAAGTTVVSLFGYGGPAVAPLLAAWADGDEPMQVLVPESRVLPDVLAALDHPGAATGTRLERGNLQVLVLPFQTHEHYDRLLWLSDCNFVRGEDSFVRAQWAERPFVWHIYPQDGGAHWAKMHTFVSRYGAGLDQHVLDAVREFWRLWNRGEPSPAVLGAAWRRFWNCREELEAHHAAWAANLRAVGDLTGNLVRFAVQHV